MSGNLFNSSLPKAGLSSARRPTFTYSTRSQTSHHIIGSVPDGSCEQEKGSGSAELLESSGELLEGSRESHDFSGTELEEGSAHNSEILEGSGENSVISLPVVN
uniref:Uncharacterized protein n=1 Tax=Ditylenchus dipsaci TaxID=166011 RepID=A0A915DZ11_9BILA